MFSKLVSHDISIMEQANTPQWAKRIENKINQLRPEEPIKSLKKCRNHKKYGTEAKKKCNPPCEFALSLKEPDPTSLSPIVESILKYMKPLRCISPIKDPPLKCKNKTKLEQDIVPIKKKNFE